MLQGSKQLVLSPAHVLKHIDVLISNKAGMLKKRLLAQA